MESVYKPQEIEKKWADLWEKGQYFVAKINPKKKPFSILLPLPNANDPLHLGHALFTIQDIMIRYHRMLGDPTLWLPGADHAGIETQFVFEKKLAKEGKSRFDFDRDTLYKMISDYVDKNRSVNKDQFKVLGLSLDMTRYVYSMEDRVVNVVLETFRKLYKDDLIYRGNRIVNFCTKCGTSFSDLEVNYEETDDFLYYLNYGSINIATTRPETIFADSAVGVNPTDKRYKDIVGKNASIPLIDKPIPIISDPLVKKDFGTGALKITPAHALDDFEIGQRHNLAMLSVIDRFGRLNYSQLPELHGLKVKIAREKTVELLKAAGKIVKIEPISHSVGFCYRCKTTIEPMLIPQWFLTMKPLAKKAIEAVKTGKTKVFPKKRFEKMYFDWLNNIYDWNISRQIVWGPRIPIWYCLDCSPDITITFINKDKEKVIGSYKEIIQKYTLEDIQNGLQSLIAGPNAQYSLDEKTCQKCSGLNLLQETDTFDTWFLSGQWPLTSLGANLDDLKQSSEDFKYFYPTSVLDTLWDILFFWVARMMMLGIYLTGNVPFRTIHLHARVVDKLGQKMSKSKGNVINPVEMIDKYGADALRMALIIGVAPAGNIFLGDEKVRGMRNFINKLWNAGRFLLLKGESFGTDFHNNSKVESIEAKEYISLVHKQINQLIKQTSTDIDSFQFGRTSDCLYQYIWHMFCDINLEKAKPFLEKNNTDSIAVHKSLLGSFVVLLKLLHPFMPFVTEELHSLLYPNRRKPLTISSWPTSL